MKRLKVHYKNGCTFLVTVFLFFMAVNIAAALLYRAYIIFRTPRSVYKLVYPSLSSSDIRDLLDETWNRPFVFEPFTQFKERPYSGKYINVAKEGFRFNKNQHPWPPDFVNNYVVFVFGGSTTFGYGVRDDETVVSYLQECLTKIRQHVSVYNFGTGSYYSSQERVLFEKLIAGGFVPSMAIFIDGLNDFFYTDKEPKFSDSLRYMMESPGLAGAIQCLGRQRHVGFCATLLNRLAISQYLGPKPSYEDSAAVSRALDRYLTNKKLIEAASRAYGVKCLFVWQPVPTYGYDLAYHVFLSKTGLDIIGDNNWTKLGYRLAKQHLDAGAFGDDFCWCAEMQRGRKEPLYVDTVHYTARFSQDFAGAICNCVQKNGLELVVKPVAGVKRESSRAN